LGGGSSNVAAILSFLNAILDLNWDAFETAKHALSISRDSYFFSFNKPAIVSGIADQISFLPRRNYPLKMAIINPRLKHFNEKAAMVMGRVHSAPNAKDIFKTLSKAWLSRDVKQIQILCDSFLTDDLVPEYRKVFDLKRKINHDLDLPFTFSGTGPFLVLPVNFDFVDSSHCIYIKDLCRENGAEINIVDAIL